MLFAKEEILVFATENKLYLYSSTRGSLGYAEFSDKELSYLEIQDIDAFEASLKWIAETKEVKNAFVTVLLGNDLIFTKVFSSLTDAEEKSHIENFLSLVPLKNSDIVYKAINDGDTTTIYSANSKLVEEFTKILGLYNCKVLYICPAELVTPYLGSNLESSKVLDILRNRDRLRISSLLENNNIDKPPKRKKVLLIGIGITAAAILLVVLGVVGAILFINGKPKGSSSQNTDTSAPPKVTTSEHAKESTTSEVVEPVITYLKKEQLTFSVLNGSRIPGQASTVKDALTTAGYLNIQTDNSDEVNTTGTKIYYTPNVSVNDKISITNVIKGLFSNVQEATQSSQSETNVRIITSK